MESYQQLYQRAVERKGSPAMLEQLLSKPLSHKALCQLSDDSWLAEFTRKVFQSGFYWSVINAKWQGFEEVFWQFEIKKLLMMSPEILEQKASDPRIVRNFKKVQTVIENCYFIHETALEHGSFSQFIANWQSDNIVGLWLHLKKHGARLGGNTGAYTLRVQGKDTFILSKDVESYCRAHQIIDGSLYSKKSLYGVQNMFNDLQQQSGRSLQELSQLVAFSVGDNKVGINAAVSTTE